MIDRARPAGSPSLVGQQTLTSTCVLGFERARGHARVLAEDILDELRAATEAQPPPLWLAKVAAQPLVCWPAPEVQKKEPAILLLALSLIFTRGTEVQNTAL